MCRIADIAVAAFLLVAGYKDWKTKQISVLFLSFFTIAVILMRFLIVRNFVWSTAGGILIGLAFFVVSKCTREAIGYGDSWLIFILGIYLGGLAILEVVLGACFLSSLFSIFYCIRKGWNKKHTIPFVPFLAIAYTGVVLL